jgi:hypothetical protein
MSLYTKAQAMLVTVMVVSSLTVLPARGFAQAPGFRNTGDMTFARFSHAAVVLADGTVLVVSDFSAERYDPAANTFTFFAFLNPNHGRGLTATRLADGRVLVVGGQIADHSIADAQIFDPISGLFSPTGSMSTPRSFHTATGLPDGRVLVTGGHQFNAPNSAVDSAEVWDPGTGSFMPVGSMSVARESHSATLLPDGRVLIAGGYGTNSVGVTAAETFDPGTLAFTGTDSLGSARAEHSATLMANGTVLIAGGLLDIPGNALDSAEIYDPAGDAFTPTGSMTVPRGAHAAATLTDGTILIAGGYTAFPFLGVTHASAEIYDPAAGTFAATASMPNARGRFIAASLQSGDVLVAGGLSQFMLSQAEAFTMELVDTEPPVIDAPDDMTVITLDPQGTTVFFNVTATDEVDANPQVVCSPPSGSVFPLGITLVTCTATDSFSNFSTATFNVTVVKALEITATFDGSGTVDPITGIATVSGTATCSRSPQFFSLSGELIQVISNRATLSGSFFAQITCEGGTSAAWSATVSSFNGRFKAGKADASLSGFACDNFGSCAGAGAARSIQLRAKK